MRMLMRVHIPVEQGNAALQEGRLQSAIEQMLGNLHPEAAYFFADQGRRSTFIVFDMQDSSQIPVLTEPLFTNMHAEVDFTPVMTIDDLRKGLSLAGGAQGQGQARG